MRKKAPLMPRGDGHRWNWLMHSVYFCRCVQDFIRNGCQLKTINDKCHKWENWKTSKRYKIYVHGTHKAYSNIFRDYSPQNIPFYSQFCDNQTPCSPCRGSLDLKIAWRLRGESMISTNTAAQNALALDESKWLPVFATRHNIVWKSRRQSIRKCLEIPKCSSFKTWHTARNINTENKRKLTKVVVFSHSCVACEQRPEQALEQAPP